MRVRPYRQWFLVLLSAAVGCAVAAFSGEVQLASSGGVTLGPDDTLELVLRPGVGGDAQEGTASEIVAWVLPADAAAPGPDVKPVGRAYVWPSATRPGEWLVHLRGLKPPTAETSAKTRYDLLVRWRLPGKVPGETRLKNALAFRSGLPDVVLLLDGSDSMGVNDPNRLRVEAARSFFVMALRSGGIGRIAVVQFSSKVRTLLPLTPLGDSGAFVRALQEINESGMTDIDGSLRRALEMLRQGDERNPAAVVLLTDGKQEPSEYRDAHQQLAAAGIPVHTVALGKSADRVLLRRVAQDCGGTFSDAARDRDLLQLYGAIASRIAGGRMIQAADVPAAGGEMAFPVDGSCRLLAVGASEPGTLDLTLPGGGGVPGNEEPHPVAYIGTPEAGAWRARWKAGALTPDDGARIESSAHTPLYPLFFRARMDLGAPVEIDVDDPWVACSLAEGEGGYGQAEVRVTALIDRVPLDVQLFDDGQHGDGASGDGVFAGPVSLQAGLKAEATGTLRVVVTGRRTPGEAYRRESESPCVLHRGGVRQLLTSGKVDLGERWAGETLTAEVSAWVRGAGGELQVTSQAPDLGGVGDLSRFLTLENLPAELHPRRNERLRWTVRLPMGLEPGRYGGLLELVLEGGPDRKVLRARVPWRVVVRRPDVTIEPAWLNLGALKPGESRSAQVRLATRGGRALVRWGSVLPRNAPPWSGDGTVQLHLDEGVGTVLNVTPEGRMVTLHATAMASALFGGRVDSLPIVSPDGRTQCALTVQSEVVPQWLQVGGDLAFGSVEAGDTKALRLQAFQMDRTGAGEVRAEVSVQNPAAPAIRVDWVQQDAGPYEVTLRTRKDAAARVADGFIEFESPTASVRRPWRAQVVVPALTVTPPTLDLGGVLPGGTVSGAFQVSLAAVRHTEVDVLLEDPPRKPAVPHIWMPNRTVAIPRNLLEAMPDATVHLPVEIHVPDGAQDGLYRLALRLDSRLGRKVVEATFQVRSPVLLPLFHVSPTSVTLKVARNGTPTPAALTIESHVDRDLQVRAWVQPVQAGDPVCAELVPGEGQGLHELVFLLPARAELGLVVQGLSNSNGGDACTVFFESGDEKQAVHATIERSRAATGGLTREVHSRFDWFRILFFLLLLLLLMLILALTKRKWIRYTAYALVAHAALMLVAVPASTVVDALPPSVQLTLIGSSPDEVVETSPEQARRIRDLPSVVALNEQARPKESDALGAPDRPELGSLPKTPSVDAPQTPAELAQASAPDARAKTEWQPSDRSAPQEQSDPALRLDEPPAVSVTEPRRKTQPDRAPAQARLTATAAPLAPPPPDAPRAEFVPETRPVLQQASVQVERREVPLDTFAQPTRVVAATEDVPLAMEPVQPRPGAMAAVAPQRGAPDVRAFPAVASLADLHAQPVSFRVPAGGEAERAMPNAVAHGTLDPVTGDAWVARGSGAGTAVTGSLRRGAGTPGAGQGDASLDLGPAAGFAKAGQGIAQGRAAMTGRPRPAGAGSATATGVGSGGGPPALVGGTGWSGGATLMGSGPGATVGPLGGGSWAESRHAGGETGAARTGGGGGTGDAPIEFGGPGRSVSKTAGGKERERAGGGTSLTGRAQPVGGIGLASGAGAGGPRLEGLGRGTGHVQIPASGNGRSDLASSPDSLALERSVRGGVRSVASARGVTGIRPLWGAADSTTLRVTLGLAKHGGDWNSSPTALFNLASAFRERCGLPALEVKIREVPLIDAAVMKGCALVLVTSNEPIPWTPAEQDAMRDYAAGGGLLWVNDSSATEDQRFDQAFQAALPRIFPGARLERLERDDPLFTSAYDLTRGYKGYPLPPGDKYREEFARGVRSGVGPQARLALLYTRNDYADGLEIDPRSVAGMKSLTDLAPDEMLEGSLRVGINALAYALGSSAPRMPPPPETAAEMAKMYRYRGPALPLFDDFEKDADEQGQTLWNVDDWGNPADRSFVRAAQGRELSVRMKSGEKAKVGVSRLVELDLSEAKAVVLDLYSGLPEGFNAALLFSVKPDWEGFETRPVFIRPGWNRNLRFPLTLDDFKSARNDWKEYNSAFHPRKDVARLSVLLYNLHVDGEVRIDNLRVER